MNEKTQLYTVSWRQVWPEWQQMQTNFEETRLRFSDMAESRMVLDYIMGL